MSGLPFKVDAQGSAYFSCDFPDEIEAPEDNWLIVNYNGEDILGMDAQPRDK